MHRFMRYVTAGIVGERERANLVVRTERFFRILYIYISGTAYVISNSTRACANQCKFAILAVRVVWRSLPISRTRGRNSQVTTLASTTRPNTGM